MFDVNFKVTEATAQVPTFPVEPEKDSNWTSPLFESSEQVTSETEEEGLNDPDSYLEEKEDDDETISEDDDDENISDEY